MDYQKHLATAIEWEQNKFTGTHEWILNTAADAVRLANYLRGHGYKVEYKAYHTRIAGDLFYVGLRRPENKLKQ